MTPIGQRSNWSLKGDYANEARLRIAELLNKKVIPSKDA